MLLQAWIFQGRALPGVDDYIYAATVSTTRAVASMDLPGESVARCRRRGDYIVGIELAPRVMLQVWIFQERELSGEDNYIYTAKYCFRPHYPEVPPKSTRRVGSYLNYCDKHMNNSVLHTLQILDSLHPIS